MGKAGEFGTVEPGAYADLIAVRGDPLTDMTLVRDPILILEGGRIVGGMRQGDR
jgi:imidazolonepropionase-like amidohydrolase